MTETATKAPVTVGTVFARSWGYDQTQVDFYEIVSMSKTGKTGKARKIKSEGVGQEERVTAATGEDRFVESAACSRCSNYHRNAEGKTDTTAPGWDGHAWSNEYTWQAKTNKVTVTHYGDGAYQWDGRSMYATRYGTGH